VKVKKDIKWVLIILSIVGLLVGLLIIGFIGISVLIDIWSSPPDPYGHLFDSQDLPPGAVNGEWLELKTSRYDTTLSGIEKLSKTSIVVRVRVTGERRDRHTTVTGQYYWNHLFSFYAADVLEVYTKHYDSFGEIVSMPERLEFAQIQRIVEESRKRWFDPSFADPEPHFAPFPPVRVPINIGDELILFLNSRWQPIFNPFNGAYRYCPETSTEENRAFVSVNEYNDLVLTESDLIRIRETNEQ